MTLYEELKWRGLIKDVAGEDLEDKLNNEQISFYWGTDPTADSLHIGHYSSLITDKRNSFSINNIKNFKTKLDVTQFGRICEDLEIELKCNSNYLFKPNTERENGTFKRRLKAELRHEGVINIDKWLYK